MGNSDTSRGEEQVERPSACPHWVGQLPQAGCSDAHTECPCEQEGEDGIYKHVMKGKSRSVTVSLQESCKYGANS